MSRLSICQVSGRFVIHTSGGSTFKIYGTSLDRQKIFMYVEISS